MGLVNTLIKESMSYFPTSYLMDVVGLVYIQYWIQDNANRPSKLIKDHHSHVPWTTNVSCLSKSWRQIYPTINHKESTFHIIHLFVVNFRMCH